MRKNVYFARINLTRVTLFTRVLNLPDDIQLLAEIVSPNFRQRRNVPLPPSLYATRLIHRRRGDQ